MGKGDLSSRKGKINRGTAGKTRQKRKKAVVKKVKK
ncbi:MAG: 30S ribosomal protein THX [Candidatus Delongbacteria bacterium]|nr:30S ribosomal protein THX [Candidatus Delongbacteria bacterium]